MVVQTSRFGEVELKEEDMVTFSEGLIGFNNLTQYVILDDPNDDLFAWLQSCEDKDIAFPVLEPELFSENFKINMTKHDLQSLNLESMERARVFTIITIPDDPTQMTANLKAPIIINVPDRVARQCVLQDSKSAIREPIFAKLQQRIVAAGAIKSDTSNIGVKVQIPMEAPERPVEVSK